MSDFKSMRVLIIEDMENFSASLREMVIYYGVSYDHVQIAANGEQALKLLRETRYDLVLSDYNLGEGRNGNDVLEEAKHTGLLKSSCLYLMLTAENTMAMVMGALEYQPDEYLTKPFTKEELNVRLQRLLKRRNALMEIYTAIDEGQFDNAIASCTNLMAKFPRYKAYLYRLKAELLIERSHYDQSLAMYQGALKVKYMPWAQLGYGKSLYFLEQYSKAEQAFRELLTNDDHFVPGWDWLAKSLEKKGDDQGCQQALAEATAISPRNVQRQNKLGQLALKNGDLEVAEKALDHSVKFGKNSVHRDPENYFQLAEVMSERIKEADPKEAKRMERRTTVMLEELRGLYKKDPEMALKTRMAEGKFYQAQGNETAAKKALSNAFDVCLNDEQGVIASSMKEQVVSQLEANNQRRDAEQLVAGMQREESPHNQQAVELYEQGKLGNALEVLKLALIDKPRSFAVNLNFAQVALRIMVENGLEEELMEQVRLCFNKVQTIPRSDERYELMHQLYKRYSQMAKEM